MLRLLYDHLNFTSPFDVTVFAAATTAFWGQCRLGELLTNSKTSMDTSLLPCRQNLRFSNSTYELSLPWTKTTKSKGATVVLTQQQRPLDPIAALQLHMATESLPGSYVLYSYRLDGIVTPLTKSAFLARCNTIWQGNGLPRFTGHSFRIGGTTELLLGGVHPDVVKALGRWSSDAFLVYWRSLSELAPLHVANLPTR